MHMIPNLEVAKLLAEHGARANIPDAGGSLPLHRVAGDLVNLPTVFEKSTGKPRFRNLMPLSDRRALVQFMVNLYPDAIHARDDLGRTPLDEYRNMSRLSGFTDPNIVEMLGFQYEKVSELIHHTENGYPVVIEVTREKTKEEKRAEERMIELMEQKKMTDVSCFGIFACTVFGELRRRTKKKRY